MSTITTPTNFGLGEFALTLTSLYAPVSGVTALVHNMVIHNAGVTSGNVYLALSGATLYETHSIPLYSGETVHVPFSNEGLIVEYGDALAAYADAADMNYTACGVELSGN